ncbi:NmrA-like family domain-containing protein 1 [Cytospora mali]|uniref:NmrA-like family domain-containing protein 1 n=1 Tax=Cytospora mali TaxID=578113 RepID=A0A194ULQ7_CYTMA|nr:NmrA-like family domain-containing protein 1 [Valsa mali var. pyri (nom. inval.)]
MAKKIITIVGVTGNQGISIVNALLTKPDFHLRGLTRNPSSAQAQDLSSKGVEIIQANLDDPASIRSAFAGSHIIYAITDFFEPFIRSGAEEAMVIETRQGVALAEAAAATPTLEHYIWSTLPDWDLLTEDKYPVPHAKSKADVDLHIRQNLPDLAAKTTFFWITFYHTNILFPVFQPLFVESANAWLQIQIQDPDTPVLTIGDIRANAGKFFEAIIQQREKTTGGKVVLAEVEATTSGDMLQLWAKAKGVKAVYVKTDADAYRALWPGFSEEISVMMQAWELLKEKSWKGAHGEEILTKEDLGITGLVGLEESFKTLNFPE